MAETVGISSFLDTMQRDSSISSLIFWPLLIMLRRRLKIKTMKNIPKWDPISINYWITRKERNVSQLQLA